MSQKMRVVIPGGLYLGMSRERLETAAAKVQRLIAQELSRLNWAHENLIFRFFYGLTPSMKKDSFGIEMVLWGTQTFEEYLGTLK